MNNLFFIQKHFFKCDIRAVPTEGDSFGIRLINKYISDDYIQKKMDGSQESRPPFSGKGERGVRKKTLVEAYRWQVAKGNGQITPEFILSKRYERG